MIGRICPSKSLAYCITRGIGAAIREIVGFERRPYFLKYHDLTLLVPGQGSIKFKLRQISQPKIEWKILPVIQYSSQTIGYHIPVCRAEIGLWKALPLGGNPSDATRGRPAGLQLALSSQPSLG